MSLLMDNDLESLSANQSRENPQEDINSCLSPMTVVKQVEVLPIVPATVTDSEKLLEPKHISRVVTECKSIVEDSPVSNSTIRVASLSADNNIRFWDADSCGMLHITSISHPNNNYGTPRFCVSRDCFRLAQCRGNAISFGVINADSSLHPQQTCINATGGGIFSLCMNNDGSRIVSGHTRGLLCYWDVESGELLWSRSVVGCGEICAVDISFDGNLIVFGGGDNVMQLCSTEAGTEIFHYRSDGTFTIKAVKFNHDATRIASGSSYIRIFDAADPTQSKALLGHRNVVSCLSYSTDGTRLASASWDKTVRVWDVESGVCLSVLQGHTNWVFSVSFSSDDSKLVSGGMDNRIVIWDSASGCEIKLLQGPAVARGVLGVCFLPTLNDDYLLK